ncbi:MAG: hypothetical protein BWY26_00407 [Elusimicrobia bacterium ADurb.Bin231]|nr:MAG: hypothetical protein BWY26_00407 [Elusimicrobia bacterium ADurb.Bin231]
MKAYLDPLVIAKLASLYLKAKYIVEGTVAGLHTSRQKGQSLEFSQHREYSPGDELKHIDWKVYGKSDRYFVKQYEEETNLRAHILLDASASMSFRSGGISKFEYASYITAALSYLMIKQGDSVGLCVFGDNLKKIIPPRSGFSHLSVMLDALQGITPEGETNVSSTLLNFSAYIKKRGLIIIISDLFDESSAVIKAIKNFRFSKYDVIVFHILDKTEEKLDLSGNILFKDMETGENLVTEPEIIKKAYQKLLLDMIEKYKTEFLKSDIDYFYFNTSMPLDLALTGYLSKRAKI